MCLAFLLSLQLTFPVSSEITSSQVVNFDSSWRLYQTPILDILGYKIFITADLAYKQDIIFSNTVEETVLDLGDHVECSTSISPKEAYVVFSLTFHFGGNTYTFDYDFKDIQVPGTKSVASVPIPVGLLLACLGLPSLPINLDFDLNIVSQLSADIYTSCFTSVYEQYNWTSSGTKTSTFTLASTDTGIANIFLSGIEVLHEIAGKISISVPILGKYTLYEFTVTSVASYSYQDDHIATYYRLVVSSQYSSTTGSGWYYAGKTASFSIDSSIVEEGVDTRHVFQGWSGSGEGSYSGSLNPATMSMNSPITETALWETQHSLIIQTGQGGLTDPAPETYWESEDSSVTVSAVPNEGYTFKNWILDGSVASDDSDYSLTIDSSHTLIAQFNALPSASFTFSPTDIRILDTVHFYDGSEDLDGAVISWYWDFGDGYTSTDQNPTHEYKEAGTYTIKLTVRDDEGATHMASKTITIKEKPIWERQLYGTPLWILLVIGLLGILSVIVAIAIVRRRKTTAQSGTKIKFFNKTIKEPVKCIIKVAVFSFPPMPIIIDLLHVKH